MTAPRSYRADIDGLRALAKDGVLRSLTLNKVRFEPSFRVIAYSSKCISLELDDPYGDKETVPVRLAFPQIVSFEDLKAEKQELKAQAEKEESIRKIADFHQSVQRKQGEKVAYLQLSRGRPKLPEGLSEANTVKLTSEDLAEYKVGSVAVAKLGLVEHHGWTEEGHLLLLYTAGISYNQPLKG